MITMRERYSIDGPAGVTRADTVERPPPPWSGTQPSSGWKAWGRFDVEAARKSAYRVVVTPGPTVAPRRPSKPTRTAREVDWASSPPTTLRPPGQLRRYCTRPPAGTSTHGPGTRMQVMIPRHSFVAPPAGANAAATASPATTAERNDLIRPS